MVAIIKPWTVRLEPGSIVKADAYQSINEASDVLAGAGEQHAQSQRDAEQALRQARERGTEEGLENASQMLFERHMEVVKRAVEWLGELEDKIADIVVGALRHTVDEIGREEISMRMIRNSLSEISNQPSVTVQTCAADLERVKAGLAGRVGSNVRVVSSAELRQGESVVESPIGVLKLDLAGRLADIEEKLRPGHSGAQGDA